MCLTKTKMKLYVILIIIISYKIVIKHNLNAPEIKVVHITF